MHSTSVYEQCLYTLHPLYIKHRPRFWNMKINGIPSSSEGTRWPCADNLLHSQIPSLLREFLYLTEPTNSVPHLNVQPRECSPVPLLLKINLHMEQKMLLISYRDFRIRVAAMMNMSICQKQDCISQKCQQSIFRYELTDLHII